MKKRTRIIWIGFMVVVLSLFGTAVFANQGEETVVFEPHMFDDMGGGEYYYDAVKYAVDKGIMSGTGDNLFSPHATMKKAEIISVLWNLANQPWATQLEELSGTWYQGAASWGRESGVYPYEIADLTQPLTRGEISEMLYLYAKNRNMDVSQQSELEEFSDASLLSETQKEAMAWLVGAKILGGYPDGTLAAQKPITRAECAVLISRYCETTMPGELADFPVSVTYDTLHASVMDTKIGNFWVKAGVLSASSEINKVIAVTWCAEDQSDMWWQELSLREDGSYGGLVQAKDHMFHFGTYTVDVYVQLNNGIQIPLGRTTVFLDGDESEARVATQVNRVYQQVGWDLYACYNWVVKNVNYKKLPIPLEPPAGYEAAEWYALQAFENRQGNCYCYAAAFYQLAKGLGYDARFIQGEVGLARGGYGPHGWVIININGASYICDPESQHSVGRYNFYMQPVGSPVFRYRWG